MKLHIANAFADILSEQHAVGQLALLAGGPTGERGVEIPSLRPLCKVSGISAIGFAGVTGHTPVARLPKGHDRRAVFITRE